MESSIYPPQSVCDEWALEAYEREEIEQQYAAALFEEWCWYTHARMMGWE